jgi:hypothetical protein
MILAVKTCSCRSVTIAGTNPWPVATVDGVAGVDVDATLGNGVERKRDHQSEQEEGRRSHRWYLGWGVTRALVSRQT